MIRLTARLATFSLALACIGAAPGEAVAQCPSGNCPLMHQAAASLGAKTQAIEWRARDDDQATTRYLFIAGVQRGAYNLATDTWRDFDPVSKSWGPARHLYQNQDQDQR